MAFPNAWSNHSTDVKAPQQNRRCQSSLALRLNLPDKICPFHMKPTWQDFLFADAGQRQSVLQFLHALVQALFSIPQKLFVLVLPLSQKTFRQKPEPGQSTYHLRVSKSQGKNLKI